MSWIKFHSELTENAKRGLPRAVRFVYLELSLLARKGRGVVPLPVGMRDTDAVCDLLGGDRREVVKALTVLTAKPSASAEPMVRIEDAEDGGRQLVVTSWEKWNRVDESAARVQRYRERRNDDVTRYTPVTDPPSSADVTRYTSVSNAPVTLLDTDTERESEKKNTHTAHASAPAREAREPMSREAGEVLAALRSHPALSSVADVRFAETLDGRRAGKPVAWLSQAIADAAADTPPGETVQAVQRRVRAYCDRARSPAEAAARVVPFARPPTGQAAQPIVPEGTGWKQNLDERQAAHIAAMIAAGKDAPL